MAKVGFEGGEKLKAYLNQLAKNVTTPALLQVGFLEGATYPNGTSVPLIAALNEFGVPSQNQPPRPFFRGMISRESGHWGDDVAALLKNNKYDAKLSLTQMGHEIKGELQQSIQELITPPLADSTVARKGFAKPLIDTAHMFNSVDFKVSE